MASISAISTNYSNDNESRIREQRRAVIARDSFKNRASTQWVCAWLANARVLPTWNASKTGQLPTLRHRFGRQAVCPSLDINSLNENHAHTHHVMMMLCGLTLCDSNVCYYLLLQQLCPPQCAYRQSLCGLFVFIRSCQNASLANDSDFWP